MPGAPHHPSLCRVVVDPLSLGDPPTVVVVEAESVPLEPWLAVSVPSGELSSPVCVTGY